LFSIAVVVVADGIMRLEGRMKRRKFLKGLLASTVVLGLGLTGFAEEADAGTVYVGNTESKIFHKPGCRYYGCKACTKKFYSRQAAIDAGYRACKTCKP